MTKDQISPVLAQAIKELPDPTPACKLVQDALRLYCGTDLEEFEARAPEGLVIRVTRNSWIVFEGGDGA